MRDAEIVDQLILQLGGADNVVCVTNCMTRLHAVVKDEALVQEAQLAAAPKVLSIVHDRPNTYEVVVGPGNSRKFAGICHDKGLSATPPSSGDWKQNKAAREAGQTTGAVKALLKTVGDIFVPLIPGIIAAGLCSGIASLLAQLVPNYKDVVALALVWNLLTLISTSFMTVITAWVGYRAAERFGATPILGGMLGMATTLSRIDEIAKLLGWYNDATPLSSILQAGKGGVLAVIVGVFVMAQVEKWLRQRMPASLDIFMTPMLTMIVCVAPYVLVIMPAFGYVSGGLAWALSQAFNSDNVLVRMLVGYISAAMFLPMVACGMHHGLVALYAIQLQQIGYITLLPALAMAGAGQVGASIALYVKARRVGHKKLRSVIAGALPAGVLGVGEPLVYGVTLPMGRPFVTAGLGAGFGGAFVMACKVAATACGTSGVLGAFIMTAGEGGAVRSVAMYLCGLAIGCVAAFLITSAAIADEEVAEALGGIEAAPADEPAVARRTVRHGELIHFDYGDDLVFIYTVRDAVGLHARPVGDLAELASEFDADIAVRNGGRTASAKSVTELMLLDATEGCELEFHLVGRDAKLAASALRRFMGENL